MGRGDKRKLSAHQGQMGRKAISTRMRGGVVNYQEQLTIDFMAKLATRAALYQRSQAQYNEFWLTAMDNAFDKCHEEVYGYLPQGC